MPRGSKEGGSRIHSHMLLVNSTMASNTTKDAFLTATITFLSFAPKERKGNPIRITLPSLRLQHCQEDPTD